eukprot:gene30583-38254_t
MPTLTVCEEGHWKPLEDGEVEYMYMVEYSKSGRARCRRCSEMISKDMVRVGLPIKWKGSASAYGWINSWCHPQCIRTEESNKKQVQALFYGLDKLKAADKKLVLTEVTKTELPDALKPLDPDNETFFNVVTAPPPPPMMTRELLPFQQEGVAWMLAQEKSAIGGGILADEMGMGKTIQTIGLLLEAKAADVVVYYGNRNNITKQELEQADVVLSTFPVIEGEWRKVINKLKVVCEYCNRKLLPRTLIVHQKYFCGPEAVRTERLALRETKQSTATEKAMRTLKIKPGRAEDVVDTPAQKTPRKSSMPTMANVYRELMEDANRLRQQAAPPGALLWITGGPAAVAQPSPMRCLPCDDGDEPEIPGFEEVEEKPAAKRASGGKGGAKVTATPQAKAARAAPAAAAKKPSQHTKKPLASAKKQPASKPSPGTQRAGKRKKKDDDEDDWKPAELLTKGARELAARAGPTLVVCPTSAMMQWADEIASFTKEDALR